MVAIKQKIEWGDLTDLQARMMRALWALNCFKGGGAVAGKGLAIWMGGAWSTFRAKSIDELIAWGLVGVVERSTNGRKTSRYYHLTETGIAELVEVWFKCDEYCYSARQAQSAIHRAMDF